MRAFGNPVTVRSEPVRLVESDGTWEAQVVCDVDDFGLIFEDLAAATGGIVGVRLDGDAVEIFANCETRTAAEGTIARWREVVSRRSSTHAGT